MRNGSIVGDKDGNPYCENGEKNAIIKEVFCLKHKEFCKFIKNCPRKDVK